MKISGDEVWQKILLDPGFAERVCGRRQQEVYKPFVSAMPEILHDMLGEKVSLGNIAKSTILVFQYYLKNDFSAKLFEVSPHLWNYARLTSDKKVISQLKMGIRDGIALSGAALKDAEGFLREFDMSERQFLESFGLNKENMDKFDLNDLTIGDLLASQPFILTKTLSDYNE